MNDNGGDDDGGGGDGGKSDYVSCRYHEPRQQLEQKLHQPQ